MRVRTRGAQLGAGRPASSRQQKKHVVLASGQLAAHATVDSAVQTTQGRTAGIQLRAIY